MEVFVIPKSCRRLQIEPILLCGAALIHCVNRMQNDRDVVSETPTICSVECE